MVQHTSSLRAAGVSLEVLVLQPCSIYIEPAFLVVYLVAYYTVGTSMDIRKWN